jgi:uncharacterized membrane protein SpoIIM required for sporulation
VSDDLSGTQGWQRLAQLIEQCERRGLKSLTPDELRQLSRLYRRASSDLSLARARGRDDLAASLNQLVGRAHGIVYARPPTRAFAPGLFFGVTLPRTFRRCLPYWLVSVGVLLAGATVGFFTTSSNPAWGEVLVSPALRSMIEPFLEGDAPAGEYFAGAQKALGGGGFASFLMLNNIKVALLCFSLGLTWGLGTLYVLATNALMLGAALGLGAFHGKLVLMASVVAPHGVVELSAVVISGAAGLRLGYALVNPGDLLRREALQVAAREAGQLALGLIPLFVFAGLVEGLLSPQSTGWLASDAFRLGFGALTGVLLHAWLLGGDYLFDRTGGDASNDQP